MLKQSCLAAIQSRYETLTTVERKVADFIRNHAEEVISMPVGELAERAGAVKSAVIRCSKSLGYEGYSELKIALAGELSKNRQLNYAPSVGADDDADAVLDKIFAAGVKTLTDTAERLDRRLYRNAVELLRDARMIYVYGVGTSRIFVNELQYRLMLLGKIALAFTDVPSMKVSTLNLGRGDVAVGISHSGRTEATLETLELAHQRGCTTMCITSTPGSPITKICDCPVEVCSDETQYPVEALSARIAHLSIIDVLTVALSNLDHNASTARTEEAHELIETIRKKN